MDRDDREQPDKIQAFDTLFTNNHIQMYKILLPYLDPSLQKQLAVYIKYMEFQYTLTYFKLHPHASMLKETQPDAAAMCSELAPFCSSSEKAQLEKITELFSNIKNAKEMMETISMMKELFPEGFSFGADSDNASAPDIMQMFQMFNK